MTDNQQMITDLSDFVHANHEDELTHEESLYLTMLDQWKHLNRPGVTWADEESKRLYASYWQKMQTWHQHFMKIRKQILVADALGLPEMYGLFVQTLVETREDALDAVEELDAHELRAVIPLNSFPRLLKMEVQQLAVLDLEELSPLDGQLLTEYLDAIIEIVEENQEDE